MWARPCKGFPGLSEEIQTPPLGLRGPSEPSRPHPAPLSCTLASIPQHTRHIPASGPLPALPSACRASLPGLPLAGPSTNVISSRRPSLTTSSPFISSSHFLVFLCFCELLFICSPIHGPAPLLRKDEDCLVRCCSPST